VVAAIAATLRGNPETQLWGRRIAAPLVFRAVTVISLFLLVFGVIVAALSIAEHHLGGRDTDMLELLFEGMSALSTTGVSTGLTAALTVQGKLIICAAMFIGRLGPLTLVLALSARARPVAYRPAVETIRIG
jgi:trk system potassium uptake protein TrkH